MQDPLEEAGLGVDHIPTEPGSLEEDRHNVEALGSWMVYAVCVGIFAFVLGTALEWW